MSWKRSKRQAQLKKRLMDSSHVYLKTSRKLDQMLLKMLHNNGVYTPDDFYKKYISPDRFDRTKQNILLYRLYHDNKHQDNQSINKTLVNLNHVLLQLQHLIKNKKKTSDESKDKLNKG